MPMNLFCLLISSNCSISSQSPDVPIPPSVCALSMALPQIILCTFAPHCVPQGVLGMHCLCLNAIGFLSKPCNRLWHLQYLWSQGLCCPGSRSHGIRLECRHSCHFRSPSQAGASHKQKATGLHHEDVPQPCELGRGLV